MKTILVPTDFSENAEKALNYAMEFAKKENAQLIVLHAYMVNYPASEVPFSLMDEIKKTAQKDAENSLMGFGLKIQHAGNLEYDLVAMEGLPLDVILNTVKEKKPDLIIMGTKGAGSITNSIFGSTTAKVIEKAQCPVIAIPEDAVFRPVQKITYATFYDLHDIENINSLVELARPFNAQVTVLHIARSDERPEDERAMMKNFMGAVNSRISYNNIAFQMLSGDNTEEVLEDYLENNPADILAVLTHHRGFFEKLFKKSLTKRLVYHSTIPLMVFHCDTRTPVTL